MSIEPRSPSQLVVLGMHRSGTSCLTGLLNLMGSYFGSADIATKANAQNRKGFWERKDIRKICDALLHSAGADWWKASRFSIDDIPVPARQAATHEFSSVLEELNQRRPWVIKEPRLCLLFPVI